MTAVTQLRPIVSSFDEFWELCIKKLDKPLAKAKWDAITSDEGMATKMLDRDSGQFVPVHLKATPEELIEGMQRYRRAQVDSNFKLKDGGKFICGPAVWLNRGRWMDG
jgi:hypothetical protein